MVDLWVIGETRIDEVTMWASVLAALSTLGLLIFAGLQLNRIRQDARTRYQPLLSMQRALIRSDGRIRVWLQNTGNGPASNIRFRAWIQPQDEYLAGRALTEAGDSFWEVADKTNPQFEHAFGSIGAGHRDVMVYLGRDVSLGDHGGFGLLVYDFEHDDIFGERLPRTKPPKRRPGYAAIVPEGDAEFTGAPLSEGDTPPT